ncbi:MAG: diguanylate cyclase, partial [Campylobacterales bacterium]
RHLVTVQNELNTAKEQLVEYNSLLNEVQDVAHLGFWEMDLKDNSLYWSDAVYRIFGLEPQKIKATFETFLSYVHPDDRDLLVREYKDSIQACKAYNIIHRILHHDGSVRYVEERCRHTYDLEGNAVKSIGTVYDITERIADQYKLQRLFDLQKNIVIQTDGKKLKRANRSMLHFFGCESMKHFNERYHCVCERFVRNDRFFHLGKLREDADWIEALQALPTKERIVSMLDALHQPHAFNVSINHFDDDDFIVVFTDISETILEQFSLEQRVSRDHLTGAYSRDFFDTHIDTLIEKAQKRNRSLGVILFDIDHFKNVNDTFGHDVGDIVLKHLVVTVKYSIRDEDLLIRWGGEEFLLIAETESDENLRRMTEHIRQRVEHEPFASVGRITCSFGTAVHQRGETIEAAIKRADNAVYKAIGSGRNRDVQSEV